MPFAFRAEMRCHVRMKNPSKQPFTGPPSGAGRKPGSSRARTEPRSYKLTDYAPPPPRRKRAQKAKEVEERRRLRAQQAVNFTLSEIDDFEVVDEEAPRTPNWNTAWKEVGQKLKTPELLSGQLPKSILHHSQMSSPEVLKLVAKLNERPPGARGPRANSQLPIAALMSIGLSMRAAEFQSTYEALYHGGPQACWSWLVGCDGPGVSQARKIVDDVCERHNAEALINQALADVIRRLLKDGRLPDNFGRAFYVDGTRIPANVAQVMVDGEQRRKEHWGPYYGHIGGRYYETSGLVVGYNAVVLTDASTGIPCAFRIRPADKQESDALRDLVPELFARLPEIKSVWKLICGDGHYDQSGQLTEALLADYALHLIARLTDTHGRTNPLVETEGAPVCPLGHGRMTFRNTEGDEPLLALRGADGRLPMEVNALLSTVMRWECADPCCSRTDRTSPLDGARLHSAYPRQGDSVRANVRRILLQHRNVAESVFGWVKANGGGGTDVSRIRWGGPHSDKWIFGLNVLSCATKRAALMDGQYEQSANEAFTHGGIVNPSVDIPAALTAQLGAWAA